MVAKHQCVLTIIVRLVVNPTLCEITKFVKLVVQLIKGKGKDLKLESNFLIDIRNKFLGKDLHKL